MSTEECKEAIIDQWDDDGAVADWKRISKRKVDGEEVREFENTKTGETVFVIDEGGEHMIAPSGPLYYHIGDFEGELCVCFNPKSYWDKRKCLYDQHMDWVVSNLYGVDTAALGLDEVCENQFVNEGGKTREELVQALEAAGLTTHKPFSDFLERCSG